MRVDVTATFLWMESTYFPYMYRDASNYKRHHAVVLKGVFSAADLELIDEKLDDGEWFIPSQVGLRDLQHDFGSKLYEDDHVWHELDVTEIELTSRKPTVEMSWGELVAGFAAVEEWDVEAASERIGLGEVVTVETFEEGT